MEMWLNTVIIKKSITGREEEEEEEEEEEISVSAP